MRVIGRGIEALRSFATQCTDAGGIPVAQAFYAGQEFKDKLLVRCYGANLAGGFVTEVPADTIGKLAQSRKRYMALSEVLR